MFLLCILSAIFYIIHGQDPNFVFIIADDLGFNDLGWKSSTNTYSPDLNSLYLESLDLTSFYVYSRCSPSRSAFLSGRYSHNIGMQHKTMNQHMTCGLEPGKENTFFTEKLKSCKSYDNYYIGKWHIGAYKWAYTPIFRGGFDYFKGYLLQEIDYFTFMRSPGLCDWRENTDSICSTNSDNYATTAFGAKAVEIINQQSLSEPFSMIIQFGAPHSPSHQAPDGYYNEAVNNGNYAENDENRKEHNSMIRAMDDQIGNIVDALKQTTLWDNTYILFFSDNGGEIKHGASNYPLRGAKKSNFEGGIRVPAIISGGLLNSSLRNTAYDKIIHVTDIYKTVMDLVNLDTDDLFLDGTSFIDILDPATISNANTRDTLIIHVDNVDCDAYHNGDEVCGGIIKDYANDGVFKLIIGGDIVGTQTNKKWNELENQSELPPLPQSESCDPNNLGYTQPPFSSNNCANTNSPCFFKIDDDPCEFQDESSNSVYQSKFNEMMNILKTTYTDQVTSFYDRSECTAVSNRRVRNYWRSLGRIEPFAERFFGSQFSKANTPIYTDTDCSSL